MIQLLEIGPEHSAAAAAKLARRYAMTGGVELALRQQLSAEELRSMAAEFEAALGKYTRGSLEESNSVAYRVLCLIRERPELDQETRKRLTCAGIES